LRELWPMTPSTKRPAARYAPPGLCGRCLAKSSTAL
jgi:hypothetical protein